MTVFPGSFDVDPVSLLSLEAEALLALAVLPPDSPLTSRWDLHKPPVSFVEACA